MWPFLYRKSESFWNEVPKVSCLMVTQSERGGLREHAIECYRRQTWPRRELVIVDTSEDSALASHLACLDDPSIRHLHLPRSELSLGCLRNVSVSEATGRFVCQWDDDDLSDPARIETQMRVLAGTGADACFLIRLTVWWPRLERVAEMTRVWEGSMVCPKQVLGTYPDMSRGEDAHVVDRILQSRRVAHLDRPDLYVYAAHGANTWHDAHFDRFWVLGTRFSGRRAKKVLAELGMRMPIAAYREALAKKEGSRAAAASAA